MRRHLAPAIIFFYMLAGQAAAEDCILNLNELTPLFTADGATSRLDEKGRRLIEQTEMADNIRVTLSRGGCVHFGYTLLFENVPDTTRFLATQYKIDRMRLLIKRLSMEGADGFLANLDAMEKAMAEDQAGDTDRASCGDGTCSITIPQDGQIQFTYDFPL